MSNEINMRLMLESEREIVKNLNEAQRYRYFLGRMQYLRYTSGKENLLKADCSGSICLALLLATGLRIRVTADELYKKFFTKKMPESDDIQAAFFVTLYDRKLGERLYRENEVCHVAGICGRDVVLNCVEPYAVLRSLSDMKPFYHANDYKVVVRGLDMEALKKADRDQSDLFGPDEEFMQIRSSIDGERR